MPTLTTGKEKGWRGSWEIYRIAHLRWNRLWKVTPHIRPAKIEYTPVLIVGASLLQMFARALQFCWTKVVLIPLLHIFWPFKEFSLFFCDFFKTFFWKFVLKSWSPEGIIELFVFGESTSGLFSVYTLCCLSLAFFRYWESVVFLVPVCLEHQMVNWLLIIYVSCSTSCAPWPSLSLHSMVLIWFW